MMAVVQTVAVVLVHRLLLENGIIPSKVRRVVDTPSFAVICVLAVNSGKYRSTAVEYGDVNLHLAS